MECFSGLNRKEISDMCYNFYQPEDYAQSKKPVTKEQILYNSNYMRYL